MVRRARPAPAASRSKPHHRCPAAIRECRSGRHRAKRRRGHLPRPRGCGPNSRPATARLLGEMESTTPIVEHYYERPATARPSIRWSPIRQNLELNRLQLQYRGLAKTIVTVGRQRINLDDQRFVGAVGWRQNEQTFDAARFEYGTPPGLKLDLTYAWSDAHHLGHRRHWRAAAGDRRRQCVRDDQLSDTASGSSPASLYLVDQDEAVVQNFRQSSQTYGARFAGSKPLSKGVKLTYALSYARQSDYHRNPNRYRADYCTSRSRASTSRPGRSACGYEVLGRRQGRAVRPASRPRSRRVHKFQGWADKFLTTPPNGIARSLRSASATAWKKVAGIDAINAAGRSITASTATGSGSITATRSTCSSVRQEGAVRPPPPSSPLIRRARLRNRHA